MNYVPQNLCFFNSSVRVFSALFADEVEIYLIELRCTVGTAVASTHRLRKVKWWKMARNIFVGSKLRLNKKIYVNYCTELRHMTSSCHQLYNCCKTQPDNTAVLAGLNSTCYCAACAYNHIDITNLLSHNITFNRLCTPFDDVHMAGVVISTTPHHSHRFLPQFRFSTS